MFLLVVEFFFRPLNVLILWVRNNVFYYAELMQVCKLSWRNQAGSSYGEFHLHSFSQLQVRSVSELSSEAMERNRSDESSFAGVSFL